jgi:nucleoid-associated protein YgaU
MRGIAALALLCAVAAPPAMGQQPTPTASQPKQHTVRKGDTLWDLAGFYLNDPFRWPMIF